ncbi:ABC transporter permease [Ponticoccus sp. SC2-23]|uniref:ABC transporter permease n=1 Tax=Alexandriicola marinus TaxID=2081710 RepID=UPI000FDBD883|nr:ABC transporter permease [Alexandriicola marinus]MBM1218747.1 ABC transporter permease [Ponticoccus sp. SC6-9]MBM1224181.1 ABC transporter permease [Ponticoccus sp. SC6-15]MBM1230040.1 ABC transporter permease [Ponticoccus sp. SC6-38]MBM1233147.1 ABC transporter permease [Ponticoccus sp. SC6-45]MBM1236903.1 ABC transporter permease [Ponticoccus sp. SC6-49]MBM1242158.1 ABC transporter permease [Ponticoccus sp. SC2-64]MBM1246671.1 ABC transporter permease [Ponticoccus sp. SC6-42]MBM1251149
MTPRAERIRGWGFAAPALLWTVAFFVVPFLVMGAMSLATLEGRTLVWGLSLANYVELTEKAYLARAIMVSLEITVTVTVVSVVLAYPLAWIIAFRVPARWQRLALLLAILPFWTSYVVRSYAWLLVLAREGMINNTLIGLGLISEPITLANTRFATVTGFVHFFVMLLTLTIYANLIQLSPNYRRAAMDLGANAFQTFRHVILPLTLPGIVTGAFLTFVLCIGDYVTPQILGGNTELTVPQVIMVQLGRRADFPLASALAIVLMGIVTLAYIASARWLRLDRL